MNSSLARMPTLFGDEVQAPEAALKARRIHDPVGMWYAARLRHGIDDRMWFGFYDSSVLAPRWHTCSHRYGDGLGALPLLLRERGFTSPPPPEGRCSPMPDWRTLWRSRGLDSLPRLDLRWRHCDASLTRCPAHDPVSVLLSPEQTVAIEAAAAAAGVSSTIWLQWTADRALRATLVQPGSISAWVFPVNLRGTVRSTDAHANHCSGVTLRLDEDATPLAVREQVSARLSRHEHWRQWLLLNLGRLVGQVGVNVLYRLSRAAPGRFAGSYSNLGEWNVPGLAGIAAAAPGSPGYPVSVGTVLCNGRRSLSCRLHPVIGGSAQRAIEFVKLWRQLSTQVAPAAASVMAPAVPLSA